MGSAMRSDDVAFADPAVHNQNASRVTANEEQAAAEHKEFVAESEEQISTLNWH